MLFPFDILIPLKKRMQYLKNDNPNFDRTMKDQYSDYSFDNDGNAYTIVKAKDATALTYIKLGIYRFDGKKASVTVEGGFVDYDFIILDNGQLYFTDLSKIEFYMIKSE